MTGKRKSKNTLPASATAAAEGPPAKAPARRIGPWLAVGAVALLLAVGLYFALAGHDAAAPTAAESDAPQHAAANATARAADYVGGATCTSCHEREPAAWKGSHHARAMAVADEASVLGRFEQTKFRHAGVTSTFFKRDGRFFVNTDGPDGKLADFEIRYTFGVEPLQQYLIAFPGGRLQALGVSWNGGPRHWAASAGSSSTRTVRPNLGIPRTGPASTKSGTANALTATRPTCARTTTNRRTTTPRHGPTSTSAARPATGRDRTISPGPSARGTGSSSTLRARA